jgi:allantoicase
MYHHAHNFGGGQRNGSLDVEDHRVLNDAIPTNDGYFTTTSGMKRKKRMTRGWEISVRWKDGSSDWIVLKDLKESYPVELADNAFAQGIQDEPVFA